MKKKSVATEKAPEPSGAYSQGVVANGLVFVAGHGGVDPQTGELPEGIAAQTEQALKNVEAVLRASGSSLEHTVKMSVFLADIGDFDEMNEVYERIVPEPRPVRTTVEAGIGVGMRVEIDAIAFGG